MQTIEGLKPWLESGDLASFLAAFAAWIDETADEADATLAVHQWSVHERPGLHLKPKIVVAITWGPEGHRGSAEVTAWPGSDPDQFRATLDRAADAARAGHEERVERGAMYRVTPARFAMEPRPQGPRPPRPATGGA